MVKQKPQARKPGQPVCGARTRTCLGCGHHQKQHDKAGKLNCQGAKGCKCRKFDPKKCGTFRNLGAGGRCKMHGGKTPVGAASPHWKNGLRSGYMPTALAENYHQALHDPHLTNIREDLAMVELLQRQLLTGHGAKKRVIFSQAERKELADLAALRTNLIAAEARRIRDLSLAIPAERVRAMGTALVQATRETLHKLHADGVLTIDPNVALRRLQTLWLQLQGVNKLPAATVEPDEPQTHEPEPAAAAAG